MALYLIVVPLIGALAAFLLPSDRRRPWIVASVALLHLALAAAVIAKGETGLPSEWLRFDALGRLVLLIVSTLFCICAMYCIGYLRLRSERPNRIFCTGLLFFLAMTSLVALAQHLTILWVAMEATTLATAVLLYFNQNRRSLEATWKYLMIGSVGIALALLGTLFLAYGARLGMGEPTLLFSDLAGRAAAHLPAPWVRTAFVFLLVGYGTKMGLAPLHTWKPDAYGEAPGVVGALLAGGLTTCAFLALLRVYRIADAAGQGVFARQLLVVFGLLSMATAAAFMVGQRDFKRLLAYSSVEHMGILVLGIGIGGAGIFAALLHTINNALTKGVLFLAAGNIHRAFKSKRLEDVTGALRRLPVSAGLFLAGFFAITGSPPFGPFVSELSVLTAAMDAHRYVVGALYLILLAVIFIGMGSTVLAVVQGVPPDDAEGRSFRESAFKTVPIIVSLALVVMMGVWIPRWILTLLHAAARLLGGS